MHHKIQGYSIAIVSTGLAVWARLLLAPYVKDDCPFSLFYLSVLLTAWLAGSGPAFVAIALGTASAAFFFVSPQSSFMVDSVAETVQLTIYVIVNCVAAILFDRVKRQRELAEQRSRDNEQLSHSLREADERKDEFLALLAHELRNPLAPIRSGLVMLEREAHAGDSVHRVQQVIERQTNHLVRITDDLLDISRFARGKVELQISRMDLRDAIDDAIEMTLGQFEGKSHRFQLLVPDQPVWVEGDRVRLAQLTANLLGNAAKYTPPGGRIVLEVEAKSRSTSIIVRDNGIGFPPEEASRILQPFAQMDTSRTRDYGGLGLGLTIVSRLAGLHGGRLSASSSGPGRGSCFAVRIPTATPPEPSIAPADEPAVGCNAAAGPPAENDQPVGKRILIVEDSHDAADLLQELLESEGFSVRLARDGVAALQLAADEMPDVSILDIGLPGMDGYEVARRIRRMDGGMETRLVALTGWGSPSDRALSDKAGFDLHLVKPIIYGELLHHVESLLNGRSHHAPVAVREGSHESACPAP